MQKPPNQKWRLRCLLPARFACWRGARYVGLHAPSVYGILEYSMQTLSLLFSGSGGSMSVLDCMRHPFAEANANTCFFTSGRGRRHMNRIGLWQMWATFMGKRITANMSTWHPHILRPNWPVAPRAPQRHLATGNWRELKLLLVRHVHFLKPSEYCRVLSVYIYEKNIAYASVWGLSVLRLYLCRIYEWNNKQLYLAHPYPMQDQHSPVYCIFIALKVARECLGLPIQN